jgi:CRP/FNR family cyclic AMP-dependent transcriptional regulator
MEVQNMADALKEIRFFKGLSDAELAQIADLSHEQSYAIGEICQAEGQSSNRVHILIKGRLGVILRIPNIAYSSNEIILETLNPGDLFGWSALIKGTPWSTLRVLDTAKVLYINADELLGLCDRNSHIGYIMMKNLANLISSRLRKNRMSILNALVAMKGEG